MFRTQKVEDVDAATASRRQAVGAVLVDVREPEEWASGHAPGAVHVPLGALAGEASRFVGQTVLTVCRSGARSARAARTLQQEGVEVANVAGGMAGWAQVGLPIVRDDGSPGRVA